MKLTIDNLKHLTPHTMVELPETKHIELPEKVLQFGTGVFIRGLIDYLIDRANKQDVFNGRVVMIKSTDHGDINAFRQQDNLYTLVMKSTENGADIEERVVCAAVSRTLNAATDWLDVLACAQNKELKIIISNTTEIGIVMVEGDSIAAHPPRSYPAKLLSFLQARFDVFGGTPESGMVIIPTELIPDNAALLKRILNALAVQQRLDERFINWMNDCNDFCNSLVDRIVPGKITGTAQQGLQQELGYEDNLMIMSETFGLWAIETVNERTKSLLSFSKTFPNVHLVPNIDKFRELKLRLLNGSHNLSCAIGVIAGFKTVKEAMADPIFDAFMQKLINQEIAHAIIGDEITLAEAQGFGSQVLERYHNPYIEFEWLSICIQDTSKIRIRVVPIVLQHDQQYGFVPDGICLSFAAYMLFMKGKLAQDGTYWGLLNGQTYQIDDDFAAHLCDKWNNFSGQDLVIAVLEDEELWGANLAGLTGFADRVSFFLDNLAAKGFFETVKQLL